MGSTQPNQPVQKKKSRFNWRSILLGALGLILLVGLGGFGGYQQALADRTNAQATITSQQLTEQFALALLDIQQGHYGPAQQRLEYIIQNDPSFPGAAQKLSEVLVLSAIPTPTLTPTLTPTPDYSGVEEVFQRAQQYLNIQDWPNTISNLDTLRRKDPNYRAAEVDSMYYFAMRNYGYNLITQQGNLEGGIYQLTLAERFGPLDSTANGLREGARLYILAASFWDLDWKNAVLYFSQVYNAWPALWDGTMNATNRYRVASMRYGDELYAKGDYCEAYKQYQTASSLGQLDAESAKNSNKSFIQCFPPTETQEIIVIPTTPAP